MIWKVKWFTKPQTFSLDRRYIFDTLTAHSLRFSIRLTINDDAMWRACGADHTATLSTVVLPIEGSELLSTDHTVFTVGVWYPHRPWGNRLAASFGREMGRVMGEHPASYLHSPTRATLLMCFWRFASQLALSA